MMTNGRPCIRFVGNDVSAYYRWTTVEVTTVEVARYENENENENEVAIWMIRSVRRWETS